jgi:hypothetical protein
MVKETELIALVDLDGTLADFDGAMNRDLKRLAAPGEKLKESWEYYDCMPGHIKERRRIIKSQPGWWRNLQPIPKQFAILDMFRDHGFTIHILTKGPVKDSAAWEEKVEWCKQHVPDAQITITMDKGLMYGKVLMDDFPPYIDRWLMWRPRGLVIMPEYPWNKTFEHDQVIPYDGSGESLDIINQRLASIVNGSEAIPRSEAVQTGVDTIKRFGV